MSQEIKLFTSEKYKEQATRFFKAYAIEKIVECPSSKLNDLLPYKKRVCRFCNQSYPSVNFKSEAHIIPNFMGNTYLVNDFECDKCNSLMSAYEKQLADYLGFGRIFNSPSKRNKMPKFSSRDGSIVIQKGYLLNAPVIQIDSKIPGVFNWIQKDKILQLEIPKINYIPQFIYKSLVKIGLSLIKNEDVADYLHAFKFLISKGKSDLAGVTKLCCYISDFSTLHPYAILLRKKELEAQLPTHFMFLYYGASILQFMLPLHRRDLNFYNGVELEIPVPPPVYLAEPPNWNIFQRVDDLSCNDWRTDDSENWSFEFPDNAFENLVSYDLRTGKFVDAIFKPNK